jgi:tetratricopeptide (TPR) repeat protein
MAQLRLLHYIDRSIVGAILVALFVVPLAMPAYRPGLGYMFGELKAFTLHLAALIVGIGLIVEVVIRSQSAERWLPAPRFNLEYLRQNPVRIVVLGLLLLAFAQLFSTLLSPLPKVSFFGLYESFSGFNVYDWSALSIVLAGVALKFRSVRRLEYLVAVLVAAGFTVAVYGLAQHFGWDDIGRRQEVSQIPSSFGNPLNFTAFLVMTIPLTIFLTASRKWGKQGKRSYLPLIILLLGAQLAALWITGARGPYIGTAFGIGMLLLVLGVGLGRVALVRSTGVLAAAGVVAVVLILLPSPSSYNALDRFKSIDNQFTQLIGEQSAGGGEAFTGRSELWKTTISLMLDPEVAQTEPSAITALRPVFGVGPDMLVHSYTLRMQPATRIQNQVNAHNLPLHILVTTGLIGFAALAVVFVGLAVIAWRVFFHLKERVDEPSHGLILTSVFIAVLAGKIVEMQAGVPRVSDLTATFAIMGAILAGYLIATPAGSDSEPELASAAHLGQRAEQLPGSFWMTAGLGTVIAIGMLALFVGWDVHRLSSSVIAAGAGSNSTPEESGLRYLQANQREPERRFFPTVLFSTFLDASALAQEDGRPEEAQIILLEAREGWLQILDRDPYEFKSLAALSLITRIMVDRGHSEFTDEMVDWYIKLAQYYPGYPSLVGTAATVAASVGAYEQAIDLAEIAIETEDKTQGWSKAWYAKGISLVILGREDEGMLDLITATEKEPDSEGARQSHQALAQLYRERGQLDKAELHESLASP